MLPTVGDVPEQTQRENQRDWQSDVKGALIDGTVCNKVHNSEKKTALESTECVVKQKIIFGISW